MILASKIAKVGPKTLKMTPNRPFFRRLASLSSKWEHDPKCRKRLKIPQHHAKRDENHPKERKNGVFDANLVQLGMKMAEFAYFWR